MLGMLMTGWDLQEGAEGVHLTTANVCSSGGSSGGGSGSRPAGRAGSATGQPAWTWLLRAHPRCWEDDRRPDFCFGRSRKKPVDSCSTAAAASRSWDCAMRLAQQYEQGSRSCHPPACCSPALGSARLHRWRPRGGHGSWQPVSHSFDPSCSFAGVHIHSRPSCAAQDKAWPPIAFASAVAAWTWTALRRSEMPRPSRTNIGASWLPPSPLAMLRHASAS